MNAQPLERQSSLSTGQAWLAFDHKFGPWQTETRYTGLSRALLDAGHTVETILPFYQCLPDASIDELHHITDFPVPKVTLKCRPVKHCNSHTIFPANLLLASPVEQQQ